MAPTVKSLSGDLSIPTTCDAQSKKSGSSEGQMLTQNPATTNSKSKPLSLPEIKKAIPAEAFEKNLFKSLYYMAFDYTLWAICVFSFYSLVHSTYWQTLPLYAKILFSVLYYNVAGFAMWGLFVVGHDCGHGSFSNNTLLNDILGHVMHGSLLVPYYPWQLSHARHHMYHNHIDKDYSYAWFTEEQLNLPENGVNRFFHSTPVLSFFAPFIGWTFYLLGLPDGSHLIPVSPGRLWENASLKERVKCLISTAVCVAYFAFFYSLANYDFKTFAFYYIGPFIMFSWWLVAVTYLQHHNENSVVYDDSDWTFVDGAFETIDRSFGFGIDDLHHNITDGHVAHHLFCTSIPHYNLIVATEGIKKYLKSIGELSRYKFEVTHDFPYRLHKYFMTCGFKAVLASSKSKKNGKSE